MKNYIINKGIMLIVILLCIEFSAQAGVQSFDVLVPDRFVKDSINTISTIVVIVDVMKIGTGPSSSTFTITQPGTGENAVITVGPIGDPQEDCTGGGIYCYTYSDTDKILITPDPQNSTRFEIKIFLDSNVGNDPCNIPAHADLQSGDETWTFNVAAPYEFVGVCVVSYERGCPGEDDILPGDAPATIIGPPDPDFSCEFYRPPVAIMLVLDKSGSMGWSVTGTAPPKKKMESLHAAVKDFVGVWQDYRTEGDAIGVVTFNSNAYDWAPSSLDAGLNNFSNTLGDLISTKIDDASDGIKTGGSTSIGDGLEKAADYLNIDDNKRHVILLMSDGKQNTERMAAVMPDNGNYDGEGILDADHDGREDDLIVVTHNRDLDNPNWRVLPGIDKLDIWAVTIGASGTDIDPTIFDEIANTGVGFYLNSEVNSDDLRLFFLELLQNFLRFNTLETTRLISDEIKMDSLSGKFYGSSEIKVATSSTAKKITFCLMFDQSKDYRKNVRMEVFPPLGEKIDSSYFENGNGFVRMTVPLSLPSPYPKGGHIGEWTIKINVNGVGKSDKIPFQFYSLADDDVVKSKFEIEKRDYLTGDPILLRVHLKEFELPITNSNDDLRVVANLIKPETGIGNLLAESSASGTTPETGDTLSPTEEELYHLLQQYPDTLNSVSDTIITLLDDGAHGDGQANDGIYGYLYPGSKTEEQGHYNFLFAVEGQTQHTGPISRQHIETIYIRLKPDMDQSDIDAHLAIEVDTEGEQKRWLHITLIPRDKFGNMVGPGYQNYFIINPLIHGKRAKFSNTVLDGIYKASVLLNDTDPVPPINIQFVRPFMVITDEMDPAKIPADLLEPYISKVKIKQKKNKYISIHAGHNIPGSGFSSSYDGYISFTLDFEYALGNNLSLLLYGGNHIFKSSSNKELNINNISANVKYYFMNRNPFRLFANAGCGYYIYNHGGNDPGFNVGVGTYYPIKNSHFGLEGWYNFHYEFKGTKQFSTIQIGLNYNF